MGQIVGGSAKTKRCNIRQLSQLGTPAAGEHILVSSDNSMNAAGQGIFDCYIEGDGKKAATALPLHTIAGGNIAEGANDSVTGGAVFNAVNPISQAINVHTETNRVTERIGFVQNIGYVGTNNVITNQTTGTNRYSDPIHLNAGDVLTIKAATLSTQSRIASYDPATQRATMLLQGTSTTPITAASAYTTEYTAPNDMYVIVGWEWKADLELSLTHDKTETTSKLDELNEVADKMDSISEILDLQEEGSSGGGTPMELTIIEGSYYRGVGTIYDSDVVSNSAYCRSDWFTLQAGESITIITSNCPASVGLLVRKETPRVRCLILGNGSTQTENYTSATEEQYAVSYKKSDGIQVLKSDGSVIYSSARLDEVEANATEALGKASAIYDGLIIDEHDDLTTGYVDGKYVRSNNGTLGTLSGWAYKEIEVKAGATISVEVNTHPNIAVLAKKLTATSFEVLVVPTAGYVVETHTYTATEDMTIAVSFDTTKTHTFDMSLDVIQSMKDNVEALQQADEEAQIQDIELGFMFNKVAVIGDSMACATMDGYSAPLGASWLSFLSKRLDCTDKQHYAAPGTTTYAWLNNTTYGLGKMLADETIYNAYFIAYGHNDSMSIGEASDAAAEVTIEGTTPSCASGNTFCAYYKAIINQIRTKAPHAMIFCLPQYDYLMMADHKLYAQAVIDIANLYYNNGDKLVHHLDTGGVPIEDMKLGDHYSTVGYAYIAKRVNEEANKVIYQYRADTEIKNFGVYNL